MLIYIDKIIIVFFGNTSFWNEVLIMRKFYCNEFTTPAQPVPESAGENSDDEQQNRFSEQDGSVTINRNGNYIHCLTIIGQIEGHYLLPSNSKTTKYEHIIPRIVMVEENPDIKGLLLILNTVGGDIEAGLAIAELIAGMTKPTASLVLGGGHSIGVPLSVAAKQSYIVQSAAMTIHPIRLNGVVLGVEQTLDYFNKMEQRVSRFVCDNSKIKPERFRELMKKTDELVLDMGTVLSGEEAVKEGIIDFVGNLSTAISGICEQISLREK